MFEMIFDDYTATQKDRLLQPLMNHPDIYLLGSRRLAELYPEEIQVDKKSDYDFNCKNTHDIRQLLSKLGFEEKPMKYCDNQVIGYFKHPEAEDIDVIIRLDIDLYIKAFELLDPKIYNTYIKRNKNKKQCAVKYFNALFELVR